LRPNLEGGEGWSSGLILAAGGSSRMGSPKQLLPVRGRPMLEFVVAEACGSQLDDVVVVLGGHAALIKERVDFGRARTVVNRDFRSGMSSSLRLGLASLGKETGRTVIILGDQPGASSALLDQLLDLQRASGLPAAAFSLDGLLHPPVVLERPLWPELVSLQGDVGFRALIRARPELVAALSLPGSDSQPVDIDTPEDYQRLVSNSQ
jgi:molybdenum cofactor cytidylyltransferase